MSGKVRVLSTTPTPDGQITLDVRGPGQFVGWSNYLLAQPSEFVQASTTCQVLSLSSETFARYLIEYSEFLNYFTLLGSLNESFSLVSIIAEKSPYKNSFTTEELLAAAKDSEVYSLPSASPLSSLPPPRSSHSWFLSTPGITDFPRGTKVESISDHIQCLQHPTLNLPLRFLSLPTTLSPLNTHLTSSIHRTLICQI